MKGNVTNFRPAISGSVFCGCRIDWTCPEHRTAEVELHFSPEALDSMITLVCEKVVAARRAREAKH